jgi:hypothetical protein
MTRALYLAALVTLQMGLITANYRAIAQARYVAAVVTEILTAILAYTLIQEVSASTALLDRIGYVAGATLGAVLGIYLTRHWNHADHHHRDR